jgi:cytochrome c biogenesis protein CcdA
MHFSKGFGFFMELTEEKSLSRYRISIMSGAFLGGLSLVALWLGMNSLLVGLAYYEQRGFWVPCLTGVGMVLLGYWALVRSVVTISKNRDMKKRGEVV